MTSTTLFRPVGPEELRLVASLDFRGFPPRLPEQPIFYPVLNFDYAAQIALNWNAKGEASAGFVCEFDVDAAFASRYDVQTVGGQDHKELWVPADELQEFNSNIVGPIRIVAKYYSNNYSSELDEELGLPIFVSTRLRELGLGVNLRPTSS